MKKIPLTQGKFALVDDEDFQRLSERRWHVVKTKSGLLYAQRTCVKGEIGPSVVQMHRILLPESVWVDHRDGDGLNNQKSNLRAATRSQNLSGFRRKKSGRTSRFRGVCWRKDCFKWVAQLNVEGRPIRLGHFDSEEEAALAYDAAAKKHFKEFAQLNFPEAA